MFPHWQNDHDIIQHGLDDKYDRLIWISMIRMKCPLPPYLYDFMERFMGRALNF